MSKTTLYIDGENLQNYLKKVLINSGIKSQNLALEKFNYKSLLDAVLKEVGVDKKVYYSAKLKEHRSTLKKSRELILKQRILKTNLEKQGFEFLLNGNVRPRQVKVNGKKQTIFVEKGVDVKIAVDLVAQACDKKIEKAIICSSDSDLQPAIQELKKRNVEVIYLGFEVNPNKGIMYTADRSILIRNSEVIDCSKT